MVEGNELLLASANVLTHRAHPYQGTGGPAVQAVSQDGFGIAAGPELNRDRKLGVWLKVTARTTTWVREGPALWREEHFLFHWLPESLQWSLQVNPAMVELSISLCVTFIERAKSSQGFYYCRLSNEVSPHPSSRAALRIVILSMRWEHGHAIVTHWSPLTRNGLSRGRDVGFSHFLGKEQSEKTR